MIPCWFRKLSCGDVLLYILTVMEYIPRGELFAAWTACDCFGETLVRLYITEIAMVLGNNVRSNLDVIFTS